MPLSPSQRNRLRRALKAEADALDGATARQVWGHDCDSVTRAHIVEYADADNYGALLAMLWRLRQMILDAAMHPDELEASGDWWPDAVTWWRDLLAREGFDPDDPDLAV